MTDFSKDAKIFKALCDTKRLTILDYLKSGEKCACVLIENMNIGQSALSYHMKILCDSGIVHARQEGKWTHYSLSKSGSEYASKRLLELTTPNTENQSNCCKYKSSKGGFYKTLSHQKYLICCMKEGLFWK